MGVDTSDVGPHTRDMENITQLLALLFITIAVGFIAIDLVSAVTIGRGWRDSVIVSTIARIFTRKA